MRSMSTRFCIDGAIGCGDPSRPLGKEVANGRGSLWAQREDAPAEPAMANCHQDIALAVQGDLKVRVVLLDDVALNLPDIERNLWQQFVSRQGEIVNELIDLDGRQSLIADGK